MIYIITFHGNYVCLIENKALARRYAAKHGYAVSPKRIRN